MSDIVFRRIRGRIIPIKKKDAQGAALVTAGAVVSTGSGLYAADKIKKANFAYGRSASFRASSKLVMGRNTFYSDLIKKSAIFKLAGRNLSRKGFGVLAAGTIASGALAGIGADKMSKDNKEKAAITAAVSGIGLAILAKKAKLINVVKMAKTLNPKNPVGELYNQWQKFGMRRTRDTVFKFAATRYKGATIKASVFDAKQQDLFGKPKFDIKKWIK